MIKVSDEDLDLLEQRWRIDANGYVFGWDRKLKKGDTMHRIILRRIVGRDLGRMEFTDHINRIRTDNRRENIRLVTPLENQQNRSCQKDNKVGLRGVSFEQSRGTWRANVIFQGKHYWCGRHATAIEAGEAALKMRRALGFIGN